MSDPIFENKTLRQTFIIPLTFPDLSKAAALIPRIEYGGDIWALRVYLLRNSSEPIEKVNIPSPKYVEAQLKLLQRLFQLPVLFIIRTASQGGKFPDNDGNEALVLMLIAVEAGIKYVDVEIEWPVGLTEKLGERKGDIKLVASFHDWTGTVRWTSSKLKKKYQLADSFGGTLLETLYPSQDPVA